MRIPITHRLHYTWSGWPKEGSRFPGDPGTLFIDSLAEALKSDGVHLLSRTWSSDQIQIACRVEPHVSPVLFTGRVKGRLQHALRIAGEPVSFSRKVGMRAIGENVTNDVSPYLRDQLEHAGLADPRYRASLAAAAIEDPDVDLTQPTETNSGRYWYNLHLVLVTPGRFRIGNEDALPVIRPATESWARSSGHRLKALAVMPDHLHATVRGTVSTAPEDISSSLRAALNKARGCVLYSDCMYVGTFSEYSLRALAH